MQNSGRSQSPAAGRHGVPAGFSYAGDPGEGKVARHREKTNRDSLLERQSDTGEPGGEVQENPCTEQCQHPQGNPRAPISQGQQAGPQGPPTLTPEPPIPSPGSVRSSRRGCTGPPHAASSCGQGSRSRGTPGAGKARRDQVRLQRPDLRGGAGGSQFGPPGWSCGPHLAGAAIALLALFYKAVPAARLRHQEPGVRRVGEASAPSLSEEGAQLAAAAGAKHARERVPTGGGGRRACGDHPRQPLRVSNPHPPSTLLLDQAAGRCADTACATDSSNSLEAEPREGK